MFLVGNKINHRRYLGVQFCPVLCGYIWIGRKKTWGISFPIQQCVNSKNQSGFLLSILKRSRCGALTASQWIKGWKGCDLPLGVMIKLPGMDGRHQWHSLMKASKCVCTILAEWQWALTSNGGSDMHLPHSL